MFYLVFLMRKYEFHRYSFLKKTISSRVTDFFIRPMEIMKSGIELESYIDLTLYNTHLYLTHVL